MVTVAPPIVMRYNTSAMIAYNDITLRKHIIFEGEPYEVVASHVFRKQQRKPVNQTKLRSLVTGRILEHTFQQSDSVEEAYIEKKAIVYIYNAKGEYWFHEEGNPKDRFSLTTDLLGNAVRFLKEKETVEALCFDEKIIGVSIPIKVDLKVTEAAPAVRGNTAQGATKQVTLETGVQLQVPLFINEGDIVRVNTETGQYVERAEKA